MPQLTSCLFDRSKMISRIAGNTFSATEVMQVLGIPEPTFDNWTRGARALPLVSEKARGRAARRFCVVDVWTAAIYQRLVALTDAGPPMRAALARFLEEHLFAELVLPEMHEFLTWREANPGEPLFKPELKRTKADFDWHREAIRARLAVDPFEAPMLYWSRDLSRPWFITIDLDMLAADIAALKSGKEISPLTVQLWCDIPELSGHLGLPMAAMVINATDWLSEVDARLLSIEGARE